MGAGSKNLPERLPELREFVKENYEKLFTFSTYLLQHHPDLEDFILDVFREFGDLYRTYPAKRVATWESPLEFRIRLYRIALERVRHETLAAHYDWVDGRDTRRLKGLDDNVLTGWLETMKHGGMLASWENSAEERLKMIDAEFRTPVVLRDVLGFDDEEVVRILGLRWGVYRHRLHRGRLDYKDRLKGRSERTETASRNTKDQSW